MDDATIRDAGMFRDVVSMIAEHGATQEVMLDWLRSAADTIEMLSKGEVTEEMVGEPDPAMVDRYLIESDSWKPKHDWMFQLSGPSGEGPPDWYPIRQCGWEHEGGSIRMQYDSAADAIRAIGKAEGRPSCEVWVDLVMTQYKTEYEAES